VGVARVVRVAHGDCANAVGAAIAKVSGECDQIFRNTTRAAALAAAAAIAAERAVAAGADRATLTTIESEDMPIAYLPGNALRVRVRVAGEVAGNIPGNIPGNIARDITGDISGDITRDTTGAPSTPA
jgi:hypothetical protein